MHNCDTKIQLLLAKPYRSKWEGRSDADPPLIFLTLKWEGRAVQKGGSDPPTPRQITSWLVGLRSFYKDPWCYHRYNNNNNNNNNNVIISMGVTLSAKSGSSCIHA